MPRIFFGSPHDRELYFDRLTKKGSISLSELSNKLGVSVRQLSDWKNGKTSVSSKSAIIAKEIYKIPLPAGTLIKNDGWHLLDAAKRVVDQDS